MSAMPQAPFFITGLPRTRTAWLANLFSTAGAHCYHDLLGKVRDFGEFRSRLQPIVPSRRGDSDSGLLLLFDRVSGMFPLSHWLLVLRPVHDCIASLKRAAAGTQWETMAAEFETTQHHWLARYRQAILEMSQDNRVRVVMYEELDNFNTVDKAAEFLGLELTRERFDFLNTLRVEAVPAKTPVALADGIKAEMGRIC
jgi:hypothetical protein